MKLIKGYLNTYNLNLEYILRKTRLRRKYRKISINKIFLGDGEFKHTNDKVNITLYVYNRQKLNYYLKLKKRYIRVFRKSRFTRKLKLIKNVGFNILNKQKNKSLILANVIPKYKYKIDTANSVYFKRFIKKSFKRLRYYMYFKQMLYINKAKYDNTYLQGLISLIRNIYKKNVEFNIINLKYFFLIVKFTHNR